jgi:hypothetical protein
MWIPVGRAAPDGSVGNGEVPFEWVMTSMPAKMAVFIARAKKDGKRIPAADGIQWSMPPRLPDRMRGLRCRSETTHPRKGRIEPRFNRWSAIVPRGIREIYAPSVTAPAAIARREGAVSDAVAEIEG